MEHREDDIITMPLDPDIRTKSMYGRITNREWLKREQARIQNSTRKRVDLVPDEEGYLFLAYARDKLGRFIHLK